MRWHEDVLYCAWKFHPHPQEAAEQGLSSHVAGIPGSMGIRCCSMLDNQPPPPPPSPQFLLPPGATCYGKGRSITEACSDPPTGLPLAEVHQPLHNVLHSWSLPSQWGRQRRSLHIPLPCNVLPFWSLPAERKKHQGAPQAESALDTRPMP